MPSSYNPADKIENPALQNAEILWKIEKKTWPDRLENNSAGVEIKIKKAL